MARDDRQVEKLIREVALERFPGGRIVSVRIKRDTDIDGDPIFVVQIVVDKDRLDAKQASGLTRHIRSKLAEIGEYDFPLLSFVSKSEAGAIAPEAA